MASYENKMSENKGVKELHESASDSISNLMLENLIARTDKETWEKIRAVRYIAVWRDVMEDPQDPSPSDI